MHVECGDVRRKWKGLGFRVKASFKCQDLLSIVS